MARYKYEYFSGANISVNIEDAKILEAVGITYNMMDSKTPIYGYSSAMFDAVAPGQILVQGSLAVNFVNSDYLHDKIKGAQLAPFIDERAIKRQITESELKFLKKTELNPDAANPMEKNKIRKEIESLIRDSRWTELEALGDVLKRRYTGRQDAADDAADRSLVLLAKNPLSSGPVDIKITFGGTQRHARRSGVYTVTLISAFFIGRASTIQIDENVIIEEYPFFARTLVTEREDQSTA